MIKSLYIRNYALIDELEMHFSDCFTTITGETGAGKSILMGALSLILGHRSDSSILKLKDSKCIVEGEFTIGDRERSLFKDNDIDFETVSTIRREIAPSGKSRAFVNDTPVNLPLLKDLGTLLVDIHSQHQSLLWICSLPTHSCFLSLDPGITHALSLFLKAECKRSHPNNTSAFDK